MDRAIQWEQLHNVCDSASNQSTFGQFHARLWEDKMKKLAGLLLATFAIVIAGWLMYELILFFVGAEKDIKAALIGVFGITLAAVFSHYFAQKREISSRQFAQKAKAYEGIFSLIFDILKHTKKNKQMSEREMFDRMIAIKRDLMIWGGRDVIKAWSDFESESGKGADANVFKSIEHVFRALRKELGHRDLTLADGDLVKWFVQASDHSLVDEQMKRK